MVAPGIDYRERSPLVIPPTRDLPPPQAAGTASSNPAWPREADRKVVIRNNKNVRATTEEPGSESALTPNELNRGINPRAPRVTDPSQNTGSIEEANIGRPMSPAQLNNKGIFNWNALMGTHLNEQAKFERGADARLSDPASSRISDAVGCLSVWHGDRQGQRLEDSEHPGSRGWSRPIILARLSAP